MTRMNRRNKFNPEFGVLNYKGYRFPVRLRDYNVYGFLSTEYKNLLDKIDATPASPNLTLADVVSEWERGGGRSPNPNTGISIIDGWINDHNIGSYEDE